MHNQLDILCKTFIKNRDLVKSTFKWDSNYMFPVCSSIFIGKRISPNKENLIKCHQILKENIGIFSSFNSTLKPVIVSKLCASTEPEIMLKQAIKIHDMLKKEFKSSEYLVLSSMMLTDLSLSTQEYTHIICKAKEIYNLSKASHPLLTSSEDIPFCILAALSNNTPKDTSSHAEECYVLLKPYFSSANAVQSLAHVLSLYNDSSVNKVDKVIKLYDNLKAEGYKYGKGYELASLGILAMLPIEVDTLISQLTYVDKFLGTQKGYGLFGFSKCNKLMHGSMLLCSHYLDNSIASNLDMAITSSLLSLIIAEQSAIMVSCITASAAASNASTNS